MITREELGRLLTYDAETGVFYRAADRIPFRAGEKAGWYDKGADAWKIEINGKAYLVHRLAWFWARGEWPAQIDHINGDRSDNRLCNLRPADNSQNQANMPAKSNNRLGIRGVSRRGGGYIVQLRKHGVHYRGRFKTLAEATAFATETSRRIHGEFSIHSRPSIPTAVE